MNKGRVIGGFLKRQTFFMPISKETRPTSDALKERIFNILSHRYSIDFEKTIFIDLFAGSGAIGIEAISRGCLKSVFIDESNAAVDYLKTNVEKLKITKFSKVIKSKIEKISDISIKELIKDFETIVLFFDPPYSHKKLLIEQVERFCNLLCDSKKKIIFIIESDSKNDFENLTKKHEINNGYKHVLFGILLATQELRV